MDSKKFFSEIRKIIREEVNSALDKRLTESKVPVNDFKKDIGQYNRLQKEIKNNKSGRATLSELLNETVEEMQEKTLSFTSADAQYFNRETMAEMMGIKGAITRGAVPLPPTGINGEPIHNIDEKTKEIVTKDYSQLMKKLNLNGKK